MKVAVIGCGLRTPLLIHGIANAALGVRDLALYDVVPENAQLMASLGTAIAARNAVRVSASQDLRQTIAGCSFVISSIRVGGMEARARDERVSLEAGIAGQETTGPAGFAMALRTIPTAIAHARLVAEIAPQAYLINFTNPAGLITQAIGTHSNANVVGICDTPAELFQQIAWALDQPIDAVDCEYVGLNHLGWVTGVHVGGRDVLPEILHNPALTARLYPAPLFSSDLLQSLGMLPTEYVYFYYHRRRALENQLAVGSTRGEELLRLNQQVLGDLRASVKQGNAEQGLASYRTYLNRRNSSYLKLEGSGQSASAGPDMDWDPFEGATGYHRIAIEAITALSSTSPRRVVLNVPNHGVFEELQTDDVIEVPCLVSRNGIEPRAHPLPEAARGLTQAVKTFERLTIRAAIERSPHLAALALMANPLVQDYTLATQLVERLDPFAAEKHFLD